MNKMIIGKLSINKNKLIQELSKVKGNISAKGDEYISLDILIGIPTDSELNDCAIVVSKKKGEYDKPSVEIAKFRTLENHKIFMQQRMQYFEKVKEISRENNNGIDF